MVAIAKEREIMRSIEEEALFAPEENAVIDKTLSDSDIATCRDKVASLLSIYDPFVGGLEKVTIHKRLDMRRGLANSKLIQIRCLKDIAEFENIFLHELGHVVDLNFLKGNESGFSDKFDFFGSPIDMSDPSIGYYGISFDSNDKVKDEISEFDFVSGYAKENIFEDFAETFLMYIKYGPEFRSLIVDNKELESKYVFIRENVFDGYEFDIAETSKESVLSLFSEGKNRPFDISVIHKKV